MSPVLVLLLALFAGLSASPSVAGGGARSSGHASVQWNGGGHTWGGGAYRPVYRPFFRPFYSPGYGGWWYGYPAYGFGLGLGLGYGAGWSVTAGFPGYYGVWSPYPADLYGYVSPSFAPLVSNEDLVFVQQPPAVAPAPSRQDDGFWYYCADPAGYHPYVQRCSHPWIAVQPQPSPPRP